MFYSLAIWRFKKVICKLLGGTIFFLLPSNRTSADRPLPVSASISPSFNIRSCWSAPTKRNCPARLPRKRWTEGWGHISRFDMYDLGRITSAVFHQQNRQFCSTIDHRPSECIAQSAYSSCTR